MRDQQIDELERILAEGMELRPRTGFSNRVMHAVREEATATAPIPFPWVRFLPGLCLNLALLLGAAVWMILQSGSHSVGQPLPSEWMTDPEWQELLWAALTLSLSGVLAWTVSRWVAPQRATLFLPL